MYEIFLPTSYSLPPHKSALLLKLCGAPRYFTLTQLSILIVDKNDTNEMHVLILNRML